MNARDDRILRLPEVTRRTGLSRASVYALIARGKFPAQVKLSERAAGWFESEVVEWLESRQRVEPRAEAS